MTDENFGS